MKPILALVILVPLVLLAACGTGGRDTPDAASLLKAATDAMTSASFSYTDTECHLCQPTPTVTEYAPANRIKLSDSKGHDDWSYYLIVGDEWYVSKAGIRWLTDSGELKHPFMLLFDPRVLLRIAMDADVDGDDMIDGRRHHVVHAGVDIERFVTEILPAAAPEEARSEELRELYNTIYGALRLRFWIDERTHMLSQVEFDLPPLPDDDMADGREDPEPFVLRFDYEGPVDVPDDPASMPYEEAESLRREAKARTRPLQEAIVEYKKIHSVYPPRLDPETLNDFLPAPQWPVNPFTGEPVRQSEDSPGDFNYKAKNSGGDYELSLFGWDGRYSYIDTARVFTD